MFCRAVNNCCCNARYSHASDSAVRLATQQVDVEVNRRPRGNGADFCGVETVRREKRVGVNRGMEWIEPVIGHDQDVAIRDSVCVGADGIDHPLHRLVRHLIGGGNVTAIARQFRGVLILADRVRVGGIRCLPWIDRQELMLGAVWLLDVNHRQIDVGES